ncbi:hypothetical protein P171DRAFT_8392 [Karstenula rhodostoma CBS 690.94]|uniref:Uncharacterized protein n=1 Tax=Karstenula rhodostoma CBS 690.94 TaxID=1392251 RepID=A0A9P4PUE7_9PLEO|nr:hypothetical protein P171DRAFT_8392 [Karstenula rhodostoma CBS 690.94]
MTPSGVIFRVRAHLRHGISPLGSREMRIVVHKWIGSEPRLADINQCVLGDKHVVLFFAFRNATVRCCLAHVVGLLLDAIRTWSDAALATCVFVNGPVLLLTHGTAVPDDLATAARLDGGGSAVRATVDIGFIHTVERVRAYEWWRSNVEVRWGENNLSGDYEIGRRVNDLVVAVTMRLGRCAKVSDKRSSEYLPFLLRYVHWLNTDSLILRLVRYRSLLQPDEETEEGLGSPLTKL